MGWMDRLRKRQQTEIRNFIVLLPALVATGGFILAIYLNYIPAEFGGDTQYDVIVKTMRVTIVLFVLSLPFWPWSPKRAWRWHVWLLGISSLSLVIFTSITVFIGSFDFQALLFHYEFGVAGLKPKLVYTIALILGSTWLIMLFSTLNYFQHSRWGKAVLYGLVIVYFAANPMLLLSLQYAQNRLGLSASENRPNLQQLYRRPDPLSVVTTPKNLIVIYLEGIERTYRNQAAFGQSYDAIAALEPEGMLFTEIGEINSTGWTIAGIVASHCGLPLLRHGVYSGDKYGELDIFLPNAVCLGDILNNAGYTQEFLLGSYPEFASRNIFFETHGFDRIIGRQEMPDVAPDDRNEWGLFDDDLLIEAGKRIVALEASGKPYHFSVLTLGPHGPLGYLSKACRKDPTESTTMKILEAVECTARDVAKFVEFIQANVDMTNTVVVLLSDHLAHGNDVSRRLNALERRNTVMFFGSDVPQVVIDKSGSLIDVFPTILDLLGVRLEDNSAGLGVSLLSDRPTLLDEYGLSELNSAIMFDKAFARTLWEQ